MGKGGIPDRWTPYSPMGTVIPGTRFVACKVPLKEALLRNLPEHLRFGPKELMEAFPTLGLLVDLTNTNRYYAHHEITNKQIQYEKLFCPGHVIPPNSVVNRFFEIVDEFLKTNNDRDSLIAVHCTHGINRTGYFICRYMIQKMNISPDVAVESFQEARGHNIERKIYVDDLKGGCKGGSEKSMRSCPVQWRKPEAEKRMKNERDARDQRTFCDEATIPEKKSRGRRRPEKSIDRNRDDRADGRRRKKKKERTPPPCEPGSWRREQVQQRPPLLDTPHFPRDPRPPNSSPYYRRDPPPTSSRFQMSGNPRSDRPRQFFPPHPPPTSSSWRPRPFTSWKPLPPFSYSGPLPIHPQQRFPHPEQPLNNHGPPLLHTSSYPKTKSVPRELHSEIPENVNQYYQSAESKSIERRPNNSNVR